LVPRFVFYLLLGCIYFVLVMFVKHTQPLMVVGLYFFITVGGVFLIMLKISNILAFCVFITNVSGLLVLISYCMALHPVDKKLGSGSGSSMIFNKKRVEELQKPVLNFVKPFLGVLPSMKLRGPSSRRFRQFKAEDLSKFKVFLSLGFPLVLLGLVLFVLGIVA